MEEMKDNFISTLRMCKIEIIREESAVGFQQWVMRMAIIIRGRLNYFKLLLCSANEANKSEY